MVVEVLDVDILEQKEDDGDDGTNAQEQKS